MVVESCLEVSRHGSPVVHGGPRTTPSRFGPRSPSRGETVSTRIAIARPGLALGRAFAGSGGPRRGRARATRLGGAGWMDRRLPTPAAALAHAVSIRCVSSTISYFDARGAHGARCRCEGQEVFDAAEGGVQWLVNLEGRGDFFQIAGAGTWERGGCEREMGVPGLAP